MFIKTTFKYSKKQVKRIKNYVLKWNLYLFLVVDFQWKNPDSAELKGLSRDLYIFWIFFG